MQAIFNGVVIAEAENAQYVDGYYYFPPETILETYFSKSEKITHCPFKGVATYFHVTVDGKQAKDTAWTYAEPKEGAKHIGGHIGFWGDIKVK